MSMVRLGSFLTCLLSVEWDESAQVRLDCFDVEGVDMVIDFPNSGVALAVQEIAKAKQNGLLT